MMGIMFLQSLQATGHRFSLLSSLRVRLQEPVALSVRSMPFHCRDSFRWLATLEHWQDKLLGAIGNLVVRSIGSRTLTPGF